MGPILPCLKDYQWAGKDETVARPLWRDGSSTFMPWVALGYDHPHTFEFLSRAELLRVGKDERALEHEAIGNLRQRKASWEPYDVKLGFLKKLRMLACGDDFLAAERILDPVFLQEAQTRLGAKGLLAGVPRRGALMVTDFEQDQDRISAFLALVCQHYKEDAAAPVSPAAFLIGDGRIGGVVDEVALLLMGQEGDDEEESEDEDEAGEDDTYVSRMTVTGKTGMETVVIIAVDTNFDRLANALIGAVTAAVADFLPRPAFSGNINVIIPADAHNSDEELARLRSHLEGLVSELTAQTGKVARISLELDSETRVRDDE